MPSVIGKIIIESKEPLDPGQEVIEKLEVGLLSTGGAIFTSHELHYYSGLLNPSSVVLTQEQTKELCNSLQEFLDQQESQNGETH